MQILHCLVELPIAQQRDDLHAMPDSLIDQVLVFMPGTLKHVIDDGRLQILVSGMTHSDTQTPVILSAQC